MKRYNQSEINDQMLFDVLNDHKNRSNKQLKEIIEEIHFRGLSIDEELITEILKNKKKCPSCQNEMNILNSNNEPLREIKNDLCICENCFSDLQKIDSGINLNELEGHEVYDLLDRFKKYFKQDDSFFFGKEE